MVSYLQITDNLRGSGGIYLRNCCLHGLVLIYFEDMSM